MTLNALNISAIMMDYAKSLDANDGKDIFVATIIPIVCVILEDLINEGKIKLC